MASPSNIVGNFVFGRIPKGPRDPRAPQFCGLLTRQGRGPAPRALLHASGTKGTRGRKAVGLLHRARESPAGKLHNVQAFFATLSRWVDAEVSPSGLPASVCLNDDFPAEGDECHGQVAELQKFLQKIFPEQLRNMTPLKKLCLERKQAAGTGTQAANELLVAMLRRDADAVKRVTSPEPPRSGRPPAGAHESDGYFGRSVDEASLVLPGSSLDGGPGEAVASGGRGR
eukprot:g13116.t1